MSSETKKSVPVWYWIIAGAGLLWSLGGLIQLFAAGSAPIYMTALFAVNVLGGIAGCVLLLIRKDLAVNVLLVSLVAIVLYFFGAIATGLLSAAGSALLWTLISVIIVSAILFVFARYARGRAYLA